MEGRKLPTILTRCKGKGDGEEDGSDKGKKCDRKRNLRKERLNEDGNKEEKIEVLKSKVKRAKWRKGGGGELGREQTKIR